MSVGFLVLMVRQVTYNQSRCNFACQCFILFLCYVTVSHSVIDCHLHSPPLIAILRKQKVLLCTEAIYIQGSEFAIYSIAIITNCFKRVQQYGKTLETGRS